MRNVHDASWRMTVREYQDSALEADLLANVLRLAELHHWKAYHTHDSRRSQAGYPDLVLLRGKRLIVVELKRHGKKPTVEQQEWLDAFAAAGAEVHVWYPADFDEIEARLAREVQG